MSTEEIPRQEDESDTTIIAFATFGIAQVVIAIIALWFVVGYLIRFRKDFVDQKIIIYSVIGCLLLAFIQGCVRSFILTNVFVVGAGHILKFRCSGLFWHQIYILQLNQLLMYVYLLSRMKSLQVFQTAMYYFLLLLVSLTTIFTTISLPWYNVPTIFTGDTTNPSLVMCTNGVASDADINLFAEYVVFLSVDAAAQFILLLTFLYQLYRLCTECGCGTCGKNKFTYRILTLGIIVVLFNLSEFIFFCLTEGTFHAIRFIVYSIIIVLSFKICDTNVSGDNTWCCWCYIKDTMYTKLPVIHERGDPNDPIADNITESKFRLPLNVDAIKEEESIGLK